MRRISFGGTTWDVGWWSDAVEFSDRHGALLFLLSFKSDTQLMWELRHLLAERNREYALSRVSDQQVLEEIASLLASRQLWLRKYHAAGGGSAAQDAAAEPAPQPLPPLPRQPAQPPELPPDEPIFIPNIDAAAIAAVQREAAQFGVPFCEE